MHYYRCGADVTVVDRKKRIEFPEGINFIEKDLLTEDLYYDVKGPFDVVYHCAGDASVARSVQNPLDNFHSHGTLTVRMLEYMRHSGSKKFIFLSTVSIYDTTNSLPLNEKSAIKPSSPYGAAKLSAEGYCYAYHRTFGVDIRIARIFNTYGPECDHLFVYDMMNKIDRAENEIFFFGSGNQIRDYVYIDDLINALELIERSGISGEDYNICSGDPVKLLDLSKMLITVMGREDITIKVEGKPNPGDIEQWYGNPEKIKSLGFQPLTDLKTGLQKTVQARNKTK